MSHPALRRDSRRGAPGRLGLGLELLERRQLLTVSALGSLASAVAVPQYTEATTIGANGTVVPLATSGPTGYTPAQIRHAYGFDQITFSGGTVAGDGSGETIAIVDAYDDPNIASDLHQFDVAFGLPDPVFTKVNQSGGAAMPRADAGWAAEIALDVEWAHAIAPKAKILLVEAADSSYANLLAAVNYARNVAGVVAVSMSWGGGEFNGETSYDSYFTTPAGHPGVAFVVASGDSGAPAEYPAASPNVLSVGGTSLRLNSQSSILSESAWSGSTGGLSELEPEPAFQKGVVTQTTTRRATPDVSYDSDPNTGFPVYDSYGTSLPWAQYGGTSDAAPQWAALIAIADQGRALAGLPALSGSQLLTSLYQLPASDFHDVVSGSSAGSPAIAATTGYDLATGRGTPVANLIVGALVGSTTTAAAATHLGVSTPSGVTAGGTFSITVSALSASNSAVAGYTGTIHFSSTDTLAGLPADYTFTAADAGVHTFTGLTLRTAGTQTLVATDRATSSIAGAAAISVSSSQTTGSAVIESFDSGLGNYRLVGASSASVAVSTAAAHDGTTGLADTNGNDWIYRADAAAQVKRGDTISVWVQFSGSADGRAYFGFGTSAAGALSLVAAPNTGQLILQSNLGYAYSDVAAASQTWLPNHWYRLEVDWGASGNIVGKVFDSNGTTLLQSVSGASSSITAGGIGFRGFGSTKYWDTVSVSSGVNTFAAATSPRTTIGSAPVATSSSAGASMTASSSTALSETGTSRTASSLFQQLASSLSDAALAQFRASSRTAGQLFSDGSLLDEWALETIARVRSARR